MKKWLSILLILLSSNTFSWNAMGHRLVAQIAYDQMSPHAKIAFNQYNHALDKVYKPQSMVNSAVWLDSLRYQDINWYAAMHYIDLPFSTDNSLLLPPQDINAVWAIDKSTHLLLNKYATDFDKGIALRILLHVVGDIHQPLHAATRVSLAFPKGDKGGNLVLLDNIRIAKNLHSYWDRGGGAFLDKHPSSAKIKKRASKIERLWPCKSFALNTNPIQWANESHTLAIQKVYKLPINKQYEKMTQVTSEKRIAMAGCRLGMLLNKVSVKITT